MSNSVFALDNNMDEFAEKINIDDLYENKKNYDLNQLATYNKILNRIHNKIKLTAKRKIGESMCWFVIPEIVLGISKFDQAGCITYILHKLKSNGFNVQYIHPNLLMISWGHFIPSYVRSEYKKKTGIEIDEYGVKIEKKQDDEDDTHTYLAPQTTQNKHEKYKSVKSYKPEGSLIYDEDLLDVFNSSKR